MSLFLLNKNKAPNLSQIYIDSLINDYGASEVWPLVDIASGTTITAAVDSARNGTLTGWDLRNIAGPVTGSLAPFSDGVNDTGLLTTASLQGIYDPDVGSLFCWFKPFDAGVYSDGANRFFVRLSGPGANYIHLQRTATNNQMLFRRADGAVSKTVFKNDLSSTDWFSLGMSWDINAGATGEMKAIYNGSQEGATLTSINASADPALSTAHVFYANATAWHGYGAYCAFLFGSTWSPAQFAAMHAAAS